MIFFNKYVQNIITSNIQNIKTSKDICSFIEYNNLYCYLMKYSFDIRQQKIMGLM